MSSQQQRRLKNIAQNYEIMLYMGLPAIKPDFMTINPRKKKTQKRQNDQETSDECTDRKKQCLVTEEKNQPVSDPGKNNQFSIEEKHHSDSDSDVTWTPDLETKKREKKYKPAFSNAKRQKGGNEAKQRNTKKWTETSSENRVYNLRERTAANFMNLEVPDDDHFLYCEECNKEYDMDCPVHGPLQHIQDTEVNTEYDEDRALHTLPPGLVVKPSGIFGAGLGVFTDIEIPARVMFGPYGGVKTCDAKIAHDSGYCWQIYEEGKPSHFVDAQNKSTSNWMRYVNCAPTELEQNLVAFQYKGGIYYRSYKTIQPGTELLCWYGNEYGRELGLVRDKNLLIRPKLVNGEECFPCVFCKTAFSTAVYNVRHLVHIHGGNKLTQSDVQVLDEWLRIHDIEAYRKKRAFKDLKTVINQNKSISFALHKNTSSEKQSIISCIGKNSDCNDAFSKKELDVSNSTLNNSFKHNSIDLENRLDFKLETGKVVESNVSSELTKHIKYASSLGHPLKNNTRTHSGDKPYKCEVCGYACNVRNNLKIHMRTHSGDKPYKCEVCGYACNQSSSLKRHMRTHSGEKPYKCEVCGYACNQSSHLKRHMRTHSGEKPYKCEVCGYACNVRNNLKIHMRTHSGEKPYKCEVCGYACNVRNNLKIHMRTHSGDKPYKCEVCGYACNQSSSLKTHMRTHSGDKPYKCEVCGYACNQSSDLKNHMRTHSGEKPYKCEVCGYAFTQSGDLKKHMRTHSGEKPYKCEVCGYACNVRNNLKIHMRTHSGDKPYKCEVCGYACNQSSSLKTHMRTHSGEKPYKCEVCGYACTQSSDLKKHIRTHSGEKPYKCEV